MTTFSNSFYVDPDITMAKTLPARVYTDSALLDLVKKRLFQQSWQWVGGQEWQGRPENLVPIEFIPGFIREPLLFVRHEQKMRCLSNVCTHRAKILVEEPTTKSLISCGYHGRCFELDGTFKSMPEFRNVNNFPSSDDNLTSYFTEDWHGFIFCALQPKHALEEILKPVEQSLGSFPFRHLRFKPDLSKTYQIKANWLTYCDNYLEGFHIPFVHPSLNEAIRFQDYEVRTYPFGNVQVARCKPGETPIDLPEDHRDYGQEIYAYYWFIYPNIMLNFYHWGISVNWVLPRTTTQTEVRFFTYKHDQVPDEAFEKTALDLTESEDEAVVESVQKGLESLAYTRGRFSPTREQGVHAFHEYLSREVFYDL